MALANIEEIGVSVVICCFNSRSRIVPTVEHLAWQKSVDFPWEIILVDNNSTDGTAEIALQAWKAQNGQCPFEIIVERKAGTMHARKKGIEAARYRYLLYCDDDNWLHENYISTAFSIISKDASIAAVGGIGFLEFEPGLSPPQWVFTNIKSFGGPQGSSDGDTTFEKGCLYTAGAILDRLWMNKLYNLGFQSSLTGRDGKSLQAGEDTELTFALKLIGGKLYYSSQMHFKHFMPKGRMNWDYLMRLWESFGYADFIISPYKSYFRAEARRSFVFLVALKTMLVCKYGIISCLKGFQEGDDNVLMVRRQWGELKACMFNFETFLKNRAMVDTLVDRLNKEANG
jgi:glycosyltransferase involved in cell wall biosynthesis